MVDRPIIFSTPTVVALLAGRKTQTQRLATSPLRRVAVGDRLYVREAHALVPSSAYRASEGVEQIVNPSDRDEASVYLADWERSKPRFRPSIHMPRWASRLTLIVEEVRFQRLWKITEADARAEGAIVLPTGRIAAGEDHQAGDQFWRAAKDWYRDLWSSLHPDPAQRWEADPEVVAITFRVERANIDRLPA